MNPKRTFFSLNKKIMVFGIFLSCFLLLFCLMFWMSNRYLLRQQNRLLEVQHQFSVLVNGLHETDSSLYTYAQARSDEVKNKCILALEELEQAATKLSEFLDQPIFVDLRYLVIAYGDSAEEILTADHLRTGQFLSMYQESSSQLEIIDSLMSHYTTAVNMDRISCQERLEHVQETTERITIGGALILTVICITFLMSFSKRITRNLALLTKRAEKICEGEWNVDIAYRPDKSGTWDEVGVLAMAFYRMLETIQDQIEELKMKEAIERQLKDAELGAVQMKAKLEHAQLRTLQSRVNPHFLFNALNVIGGQAAEEGADKTLDMIFKTADYLRYSLSKLDKIVTLQEELENVEDYFIIQKRRFGERIRFCVTCEEACEGVRIPSMILQPLCENALMHGVMPMTEGGEICVRAWKEEGKIRVSVEDNGVGFTGERLGEIRERLADEAYDDTEGIGLHNIMQRLSAFFHEEASCEIESVQGIRTSVTLTFPSVEQETAGRMDEEQKRRADTISNMMCYLHRGDEDQE